MAGVGSEGEVESEPTFEEFVEAFPSLEAAEHQGWVEARLAEGWGLYAGWRRWRARAALLMTAHRFVLEVLDTDAATGRLVTSQRVGALSVSFGSAQNRTSAGYLDQTGYGQQLLDLQRRSQARLPRVAGRRGR